MNEAGFMTGGWADSQPQKPSIHANGCAVRLIFYTLQRLFALNRVVNRRVRTVREVYDMASRCLLLWYFG